MTITQIILAVIEAAQAGELQNNYIAFYLEEAAAYANVLRQLGFPASAYGTELAISAWTLS